MPFAHPEEALILRDLSAVGLHAGSLVELRGLGGPYPAAIPILVSWLPSVTDRRVLEGLVRALSVPWAKPMATQPLINHFDDPQVDGHAVKALGKLKAPEAKTALEGKVQDRRAWVRTAAKTALRKLG